MDRLWSLALRNAFRSFLNLDVLLIREETHVVLQLELVLRFAMRALDWLNYTAALNESLFLVVATLAQESGLLHFRDDVAVADDDAAERDHLVDVLRTEFSDAVGLAQVVGTHLDEDIFLLLSVDHVLLATKLVHVQFLVDLRDNEIKDRNQVRWVVFNLAVELWVIRVDVAAVNVEHLKFHGTHFLQFFDVKWHLCKLIVAFILVNLFHFNKVVDELL